MEMETVVMGQVRSSPPWYSRIGGREQSFNAQIGFGRYYSDASVAHATI